MHRRNAPAAALAAALSAAAAPASAAEDPAFGYWMVESKRAIVDLAPCGDSACATIVWLIEPLDDAGKPVKDNNNEIPAMRDRTVCGLSLMSGFVRDRPGKWTDGQIYNGEDGQIYSAKFELQDDGSLSVRGYVGVSLFGSSQVWTREQSDRGGCPSG